MFVRFIHARTAGRGSATAGAARAVSLAAAALLAGVFPARAAQPTTGDGEVEVSLDEFGAGGMARPGEWAGVRLLLRDLGDRVRNVVVQLEVPDPDGDIATHQRIVTLNPGVERGQGVWMYPRLPFSLSPSDRFTATVREADEGDAPDRLATGRRLGSARISIPPQNLLSGSSAAIAVIGGRPMGLDQYSFTATVRTDQPATTNELVRVSRGLTPAELPDAWMGLWQFETIVWGEGAPSELRSASRDALVNWVRRGGHLVVALPSIGSTWTDPLANPLYDIMPRVRVRRLDGVSLAPYREILTRDQSQPLPSRAIVHTFTPAPDASPVDAAPILAGRGGDVVVVRRTVGVGAVTLVGIDLTVAGLLGRIDADVFWHRVLGKRGDLFSRAELNSRRTADGRTINIMRFGDEERLDAVIGATINKTGRAGVGVLLGLIVFTAYLLLAGPVGFALLSKVGLRRHAWIAFVATTAVFTMIAWGGARAIRPARTEITHLSLLDHVYGQSVQRVRAWMSALVPEYGDATFAFADEARAASLAGPSALSAWDDPEAVLPGAFPDTRPYAVDTRRPTRVRAPTRATVKRLVADWAGPPALPMPQPVDGPVRIDETGRLRGGLRHGLPAPLERVRVILVRRQTPLGSGRLGGPLLAITRAWDPFPGGVWAPGATLDLATLDAPSSEGGPRARLQTAEDYFRAVGAGGGQAGGAIDLRSAPRRLEALAWAPLLEPPDWQSSNLSRAPLLQRRAGHRMDVARWFTQPCLIVVGQLEDAPLPVAFSINGQIPPSSGRTIIRWVYPLAPDPPAHLDAGAP